MIVHGVFVAEPSATFRTFEGFDPGVHVHVTFIQELSTVSSPTDSAMEGLSA